MAGRELHREVTDATQSAAQFETPNALLCPRSEVGARERVTDGETGGLIQRDILSGKGNRVRGDNLLFRLETGQG